MDTFAHDLIIMCDTVRSVMSLASDALQNPSLRKSEEALTVSDELEEIRVRCEERAVQLLALENPMAKDLRQVVSSIYIVEDLYRMGKLANNVAKAARRSFPELALPEKYNGYFAEMARLVDAMSLRVRELLIDPDADVALELTEDDDAVDDINDFLVAAVTKDDFPASPRVAVDIALLTRFYERYADHCVNVAARIVYLTTGLLPDEYLAVREKQTRADEQSSRLADLERQLGL